MKKIQKILALVLVFALCLCLLAACAKSEKAPADEKPSENAPTQTPDNSDKNDAPPAETETPNEPDDEPVAPAETPSTPAETPSYDEEDVVDIRFVMMGFNGNYDVSIAENAINAITESKIGVRVHIDLWDMGTYMTQMPMEIAGGSQIDIAAMVVMPPVNFNSMNATGQLLALDEYLAENYCSAVSSVLADYLPACQLNGKTYMIPAYRPYCTNQYAQLRTDILEELNLMDAYLSCDNWGDFKHILETIRDNTDLYPISATVSNTSLYCGNNLMKGISTGGPFADEVVYDNLGDPNDFLMGDENGVVSIAYDHPVMKEMFETSIAWQNEGLIYPDNANCMDAAEVIKGGVSAGNFITAEDNKDMGLYAHPITRQLISAGMVKTSAIQGWGLALPSTCAEPEAAMRFINELYCNADLMNALIYGADGVTYVVNDAGEAAYPEGVDFGTVSYRSSDFMFGNFFLCMSQEGYGADFRQIALDNLEHAPLSPYLGFTLDTVPLSDTVAALSAVYGQYFKPLNGGLYTESLYNEFRSALNAAGIDDYVAAVQAQVDAWKAAQ